MDRDTAHAHWQDLSGRIKRRWNELSDEEIAQAEGDREYLVSKVHERYGLARDEIDGELEVLGVGEPDTVVGPLGSDGYANADNVVPRGAGLDDQHDAVGHGRSGVNRDVSMGEDMRTRSEMDPAHGHETGRDAEADEPGGATGDASQDTRSQSDTERQDILKDRGSATQSEGAAPLDQSGGRRDHRRRRNEQRG